MTGLREACDTGKAKAVGVCNYNAKDMEEIHGLLAKHNIPLACNQVQLPIFSFMHPLWTEPRVRLGIAMFYHSLRRNAVTPTA